MASIGTNLGRAVGKLGALAVEGGIRGASALGTFGEDALAGVESGYTEKAATLKASRDAKVLARAAAIKLLQEQAAPAAPAVTKRAKATA